MTSPLDVLFTCVFITGVLAIIAVTAHRHDTIQAQLDVPTNGIEIRPTKTAFFITSYSYSFAFVIPILLPFWVLSKDTKGILLALAINSVFWLFFTTMAYPHYTIIIVDNKISGPTLMKKSKIGITVKSWVF
jgi:hypothetical protein